MDITMATHYITSVPFCVCRLKLKPNSVWHCFVETDELAFCMYACILEPPLLCCPKVTV